MNRASELAKNLQGKPDEEQCTMLMKEFGMDYSAAFKLRDELEGKKPDAKMEILQRAMEEQAGDANEQKAA